MGRKETKMIEDNADSTTVSVRDVGYKNMCDDLCYYEAFHGSLRNEIAILRDQICKSAEISIPTADTEAICDNLCMYSTNDYEAGVFRLLPESQKIVYAIHDRSRRLVNHVDTTDEEVQLLAGIKLLLKSGLRKSAMTLANKWYNVVDQKERNLSKCL